METKTTQKILILESDSTKKKRIPDSDIEKEIYKGIINEDLYVFILLFLVGYIFCLYILEYLAGESI